MVIMFLFTKIKHFLLIFVNLFRRILCCFRRRNRRNSIDIIPLTHVGVIANNTEIDENWQWDDNLDNLQPKTIQDHIELYRKKKQDVINKTQELTIEEQSDLFKDMTPNITKQTKLLINHNNNKNHNDYSATNRLNFVDTSVPVETGELQEWEENTGWEGETLDWDAQEALRMKKRQDRERRIWEQQQKRLERTNKSLGERVPT